MVGRRDLRVVDSVAVLGPSAAGLIVVAGSHGGVSAARHAACARPFALILHEAGASHGSGGRDGLAVLESMGIAGATVADESARISDGVDMLESGRISAMNKTAMAVGVSDGMTVEAAVALLARARDCYPGTGPTVTTRGLVVTDSITLLAPAHRGLVAVCGSHMGVGTVRFASGLGLAAVFGHDAGVGKDRSGIAAFPLWDEHEVPAAAARGACIGNGHDVLAFGILSAVNTTAARQGLQPGQYVRDEVRRLIRHHGRSL